MLPVASLCSDSLSRGSLISLSCRYVPMKLLVVSQVAGKAAIGQPLLVVVGLVPAHKRSSANSYSAYFVFIRLSAIPCAYPVHGIVRRSGANSRAKSPAQRAQMLRAANS